MKRGFLEHFPLTGAYLCQDCNAVCNNAMSCPACASTVLLGLAGVLNRGESKPVAMWPRIEVETHLEARLGTRMAAEAA